MASLAGFIAFASPARGTELWTAGVRFFEKSGSALQPENRDCITDRVCLTRGDTRGLFNIAPGRETEFVIGGQSPAGTLWAFAGLRGNPDANFGGAAAFEDLVFETWEQALEGQVRWNITQRPAVMRLVEDEIYVDVTFTAWEAGAGGFSYVRATGPEPAPTPALPGGATGLSSLLLLAGLALVQRKGLPGRRWQLRLTRKSDASGAVVPGPWALASERRVEVACAVEVPR